MHYKHIFAITITILCSPFTAFAETLEESREVIKSKEATEVTDNTNNMFIGIFATYVKGSIDFDGSFGVVDSGNSLPDSSSIGSVHKDLNVSGDLSLAEIQAGKAISKLNSTSVDGGGYAFGILFGYKFIFSRNLFVLPMLSLVYIDDEIKEFDLTDNELLHSEISPNAIAQIHIKDSYGIKVRIGLDLNSATFYSLIGCDNIGYDYRFNNGIETSFVSDSSGNSESVAYEAYIQDERSINLGLGLGLSYKVGINTWMFFEYYRHLFRIDSGITLALVDLKSVNGNDTSIPTVDDKINVSQILTIIDANGYVDMLSFGINYRF